MLKQEICMLYDCVTGSGQHNFVTIIIFGIIRPIKITFYILVQKSLQVDYSRTFVTWFFKVFKVIFSFLNVILFFPPIF